jgi:hypothetical protein
MRYYKKDGAIDPLELQELWEKLKANGLGELVEGLLSEDVYTEKGRLKKSRACRVLGWKAKELEAALAQARVLLQADWGP